MGYGGATVNFVCPDCRGGSHDTCPGSGWCDCQHRSNTHVLWDTVKRERAKKAASDG